MDSSGSLKVTLSGAKLRAIFIMTIAFTTLLLSLVGLILVSVTMFSIPSTTFARSTGFKIVEIIVIMPQVVSLCIFILLIAITTLIFPYRQSLAGVKNIIISSILSNVLIIVSWVSFNVMVRTTAFIADGSQYHLPLVSAISSCVWAFSTLLALPALFIILSISLFRFVAAQRKPSVNG